jgi:hypothetical protein
MRKEIDTLDLRGMSQAVVECPLGCKVSYVLVYDPNEVDKQALDHYLKSLEVGMSGCNQHPPKIVLKF